jgi:hypothetical protein
VYATQHQELNQSAVKTTLSRKFTPEGTTTEWTELTLLVPNPDFDVWYIYLIAQSEPQQTNWSVHFTLTTHLTSTFKNVILSFF